MRYWLVVCYVGHCGRNRPPREVALAIEARNSVEALMKAKRFPGVKHHRSQYMCTTKEITYEEYIERMQYSAYEKAFR